MLFCIYDVDAVWIISLPIETSATLSVQSPNTCKGWTKDSNYSYSNPQVGNLFLYEKNCCSICVTC